MQQIVTNMARLPLLVRNITHLTDARFFAALEADYLSFNLDDNSTGGISSPEFFALIDWIEGPKVLLENAPHGFDPTYGRVGYSETFCLAEIHDDLTISYSEYAENLILITDEIITPPLVDKFLAQTKDLSIFLSKNFTSKEIEILLQKYPDVGIVLYGSTEEKTGIKSYEELDDIIDLIEPE